MGSKVLVIALAAELGVFTVAASGCASGSTPHGFGSSGASPAHATATPLGAYAASTSVQQKYGIAEWRFFVGKNQIVVTGYRADGTAMRGIQLAWFAATSGSAGHTRLTMLDGSGAVLRRMVGGGETGHLSGAQIELLQTMRYDLANGKPASSPLHGSSFGGGSSLHLQDWPSSFPVYGNTPGTGPQCLAAWGNPSIPLDATGCGVGAATFETVMGGIVALGTCTQWYAETQDAQGKCDAENQASCTNTDGTCNFGQDDGGAGSGQTPMPQSQCDQDCICANYGTYNGMPCSTTCVDNSACGSGQECHWGSCGPAAAKNDNPTDQNVQQTNASSPSCGSGDVTADPSTGQAGCSNGGTAGGGSGGSSGGGSSGSSSSTDTSGGDPTGSSGGGSGGAGGSGSGGGGGQCAADGAGCAQDADCCAGSCNAGTCGVSGDGSSSGGSSGGSGSSSGGNCAADGSSCSQDADCCGGTCDTSTGTCGSGSGSSGSSSSSGGSGGSSGGGCAADGSACAQDSDCCGGSCDTSTGTCGTPSGSSGGSGSSGSSSGGGCAPDGSGCAQDSDCCGGTCTSGTCGSAPTCGGAGSGCAQDTDCCSGSCDTSSGTCN